jgi:peptide/nickel transport system substrate-binding protein
MFIWSLDSGPDPLEVMRRWRSDITPAAGNYVKYNNPEFDKYIDMAEATRDQTEMIKDIQKAEEIFVEDAPIWFFNYNKAILAHQPWVHGLAPVAPEMMFQDMTGVWVDETSPRANMK